MHILGDYRPPNSSNCDVCCDGKGFAARECPGCGRRKTRAQATEARRESALEREQRKRTARLMEQWRKDQEAAKNGVGVVRIYTQPVRDNAETQPPIKR